jgi:drug/metabolite transporter (DMT)-like permease
VDTRDSRRLRRWIGVAVLLLIAGIAWVAIPRLGAGSRSPVIIVLLCGLAVVVMKLVERQVHQWFRRWAEKHAATRATIAGRDEESSALASAVASTV